MEWKQLHKAETEELGKERLCSTQNRTRAADEEEMPPVEAATVDLRQKKDLDRIQSFLL